MKFISKTTEYALTIALIVGDVASSLAGVYSGHTAAIIAVVATSAYAVSRGLAKAGKP